MSYKDPEKQRQYQREWRAARRARYVAGQVCANCGAAEGLELHHPDKGTKVEHKIWSWAIPRLEAELAKCEWWCGSCHDEFHSAQRRFPHGTVTRYVRGGCRCPDCRRAKSVYAKAWRGDRVAAAALRFGEHAVVAPML